jgi:uncharacterized membrane protein
LFQTLSGETLIRRFGKELLQGVALGVPVAAAIIAIYWYAPRVTERMVASMRCPASVSMQTCFDVYHGSHLLVFLVPTILFGLLGLAVESVVVQKLFSRSIERIAPYLEPVTWLSLGGAAVLVLPVVLMT